MSVPAPIGPEPASEPVPTNLDLLRQFRRCAHLQRQVSAPKGGDRILIKLLTCGSVTQHALADLLERTPATLSQQLEPLEAAGLVERAPSPTDRRTVDVRLTPAGTAAAQHAVEERRRTADVLFGPLGDVDRRDLARILAALESSWRTAGRPARDR